MNPQSNTISSNVLYNNNNTSNFNNNLQSQVYSLNQSASLNYNYKTIEENPIFKHIENILSSSNNSEWKEAPEIIKHSFSSLLEIVKSQNQSIKEIEKQLSQKASRVELNSGLSIKANLGEVMKSFNEVNTKLDSKVSVVEYNERLSINNKLDQNSNTEYSSVVNALNSKVSLNDFHSYLKDKNKQIEELTEKFILLNQDFEILKEDLDSRATVDEVNSALNTKASKASVIEALQRKVNKQDLDSLFSEKADLESISKLENNVFSMINEIKELLENNNEAIKEDLDSKANIQYVKTINELLQKKLDIDEYLEYKNTSNSEINILKQSTEKVNNKVVKIEAKIMELDTDIDRLIANIKIDIEAINKSLITKIEKVDCFNEVKKLKDEIDISITDQSLKYHNRLTSFNQENQEFKSDIDKELIKINEELSLSNRNNKETAHLITELSEKQTQLNLKSNEINKDLINNESKVASLILNIDALIEELKDFKQETNNYVKNQFEINNEFLVETLKEHKREISSFISEIIIDFDNMKKLHDNKINDFNKKISEELSSNKEKTLHSFNDKVISIVKEFNNNFVLEFNNKIDNNEHLLYKLFESFEENINKKLISCEEGVVKVKNNYNSFSVKMKNDVDDLKNGLLKKLDSIVFDGFIKNTTSLFEDLSKSKSGVDENKLNSLFASKEDLDLKADVDDINKALNNIYQELDTKANINDLTVDLEKIISDSMDLGAQITSITAALNKNGFNLKIFQHNNSQINSLTTNNNNTESSLGNININNIHSLSNINKNIGRWLWKSGKLKSGLVVPWEISLLNINSNSNININAITNRSKISNDLFLNNNNNNAIQINNIFTWEANKTFIVVQSVGLYRINIVFIKNKKTMKNQSSLSSNIPDIKDRNNSNGFNPTIQILVNGEVVNTVDTNTVNVNDNNFLGKCNNNSNQLNYSSCNNYNINTKIQTDSVKSLTLKSSREGENNYYNNNSNNEIKELLTPYSNNDNISYNNNNYNNNVDSNNNMTFKPNNLLSLRNSYLMNCNSSISSVILIDFINIKQEKTKVAVCLMQEEEDLEAILELEKIY